MSGIPQGCLAESTTDLNICCVTKLTEEAWTQQVSGVVGVMMLAGGLQRQYKAAARTSPGMGGQGLLKPAARFTLPHNHSLTNTPQPLPKASIHIPASVAPSLSLENV